VTDDRLREPDPRFSLANERTFLAWIRTAVALLAAAVAVVKLVPGDDWSWLRRVLGVVLALLGLLVAATSWQRYRGVQAAMRAGRPLPRSVTLPVLALGLAAVGALVVLLVAV
jgi:putative membrane protein